MGEAAKGPEGRYRGGVAVAHGTFSILAGDGSRADGHKIYGAGMLAAGTLVLRIAAAGDTEPSQLTVEIWDREPSLADLDQWDAAAELIFDSDESASIDRSMYEASPEECADLDAFVLPPGVYRVRAYGRVQGDVAVSKTEYDLEYDPDDPDVDPNKYPEQHLLQLWIDTTEHDDEALVLKDDPRYIAY
ncbi:hypothetical protein ACLTEW_23015 [Gordonia lacunae]|uniref:hypothetical protein n=1 Tax=Gordonia lacunae TaxID=417102 RepID=UPI0039E6D07B